MSRLIGGLVRSPPHAVCALAERSLQHSAWHAWCPPPQRSLVAAVDRVLVAHAAAGVHDGAHARLHGREGATARVDGWVLQAGRMHLAAPLSHRARPPARAQATTLCTAATAELQLLLVALASFN